MQGDGGKAHWAPAIRAELVEIAEAGRNGHVGTRLVSETDRYRIWLISLAPGERLRFHTHLLNYFWVATSAGRARSHNASGSVVELDYALGDVRHMDFGLNEEMTHDLENIGNTVLTFTTVEDKRSPNLPLPL
jgi:mannose-6-phosphate isomerase-like protein (cupin superfamily)